jgi:hypothetical protein
MRLAIAYSTKDQVELSRQSVLDRILNRGIEVLWCDGSRTEEGQEFFEQHPLRAECWMCRRVLGGADAAIAWKLTRLLKTGATHLGLLESDVLLAPDWFEPTLNLFERGKADGLAVGAVSARSYVDRVLIQCDGYACMHNLGAGMVIFTREAAEIILRSFRTHWWPDNRKLFAQLAGIDLATYAAFRGNEQWVTTDWGWEAQLARHGLASLALTPARCQMIGQNPPLEQQGLELTSTDKPLNNVSDEAMGKFVLNTRAIYHHKRLKFELPGIIHRDGAGMLFFAHQLGNLPGSKWQGTLELIWSQGFGPFAYRAGPGGASLSVRISGSCSFLCTGGDAGARVRIADTRSGFNFAPDLPANMEQFGSINVPGGPVTRTITMEMAEGATFYGLQTSDSQMLDSTFRFSWDQLPEAK